MPGHVVAKVVGVGDDVEDARREHVFDKLGKTQCRQRGRGGRLHHERVAGKQGRRQLEAEDQKRVVPGDDRPDDAERTAIGFDAAFAGILDHPHRQLERAEIAEEGRHAQDFAGGVIQRLALFTGQDASQLARVGFDDIGHLADETASLLDRGRSPGRVGGLGGGDCLVELLLGGAWTLRQHLLGCRVENRHDQIAGNHSSVDQKAIVSHRQCTPRRTGRLGLVIFNSISRRRGAGHRDERRR
jgi:hypothetical protein